MTTLTRTTVHAVVAVMAMLVVACSPAESKDPPSPANPSGVIPIPGGPMESTPTASSPKVPDSQQEAQDTVLQYLQRTVDGLPPGTTLDSSDARGGGNLSCDDNYTGPGSGPTEYIAATHVVAPAGVKPADLISKTGDLWRSWGLQVMQREGFEKPNQFGFHPTATASRSKRPIQPITRPCSPSYPLVSPVTSETTTSRHPRQ